MRELLNQHILNSKFPCIMAKTVLKKGHISYNELNNLTENDETSVIIKRLYDFVDDYRANPEKLRSFILTLDDPAYANFENFEAVFWKFLKDLNAEDKKQYQHDPRVSSDPNSSDFSFSLKGEAFFILVLHPQSPRLARKFVKPTIVFNLHQQFEDLRNKGLFKKIRNVIRQRDRLLQGFINPMLADFGEKSEVFQYLGRKYELSAPCPLTL